MILGRLSVGESPKFREINTTTWEHPLTIQATTTRMTGLMKLREISVFHCILAVPDARLSGSFRRIEVQPRLAATVGAVRGMDRRVPRTGSRCDGRGHSV
jgi:hypothetical protein